MKKENIIDRKMQGFSKRVEGTEGLCFSNIPMGRTEACGERVALGV
jgi:hypothetical protein